MRADVADVTEDKADEHEEETDQRERRGRADHLWKRKTHRLFQTEAELNIHFTAHRHVFFLTASSPTRHGVVSSSRLLNI